MSHLDGLDATHEGSVYIEVPRATRYNISSRQILSLGLTQLNPRRLRFSQIGVTGPQQTFQYLQTAVSHTLKGSRICKIHQPRWETKRVSVDEDILCHTPV